ncbi:unnamed protein product [Pleuronectes platessa]|uniref:Uncharacterized protein n=1 Tax=Pleuronectes platessa TaxID=8262 RepID=A0A9N7VWY3_PLEPL|nr:unnamed protein product [Pleuronectes platessa]
MIINPRAAIVPDQEFNSLLINKWERERAGGDGRWEDKMVSLKQSNHTDSLHQVGGSARQHKSKTRATNWGFTVSGIPPRDRHHLPPPPSWRSVGPASNASADRLRVSATQPDAYTPTERAESGSCDESSQLIGPEPGRCVRTCLRERAGFSASLAVRARTEVTRGARVRVTHLLCCAATSHHITGLCTKLLLCPSVQLQLFYKRRAMIQMLQLIEKKRAEPGRADVEGGNKATGRRLLAQAISESCTPLSEGRGAGR